MNYDVQSGATSMVPLKYPQAPREEIEAGLVIRAEVSPPHSALAQGFALMLPWEHCRMPLVPRGIARYGESFGPPL